MSHYFQTLLTDANTDTDDRNSPDAFQFTFLSGYGCANTNTEMWNCVLRKHMLLLWTSFMSNIESE